MVLFALVSFTWLTGQTGDTRKVYVFQMREEIAAPMQRKTQLAFKEAAEVKADLILIHMNTYGGALEAADTIRTLILTSTIPVWVFIDNNAASAGALISIACDSIYMREGASIGAATVVDQTGAVVPDKYQSYMRSMMRATAEAKGRDPEIAQAMVDPRIAIPGISDTGQVLTFTASEAMEFGYCEGIAGSVEEVLVIAGVKDYEIIRQQLTPLDKVIGFLIHPVVSGVLIMLIIGGIYFELQTPGLGFPSAAALLGALLYFAPLYLEGLAENWEILLFIGGIILLAVEIFAIPGFGVAGVSGILLILTGLTLSMVDNVGFDPASFRLDGIVSSFFIVVIAAFLALVSSFYLSRVLLTKRTLLFGELALNATQEVSQGYVAANQEYKSVVGKQGVAYTVLRPAGKVMIENDLFDAVALTGYIEKDELVEIVGYETSQVIVKKIQSHTKI